MTTPAEVEAWLEEKQLPNWPDSMSNRLNRHLIQSDLPVSIGWLLEVAESGEQVITGSIRNAEGGKRYLVSLKLSDVTFTQQCADGHDWGEWRYDYMGGDLRRCNRCDETEHV